MNVEELMTLHNGCVQNKNAMKNSNVCGCFNCMETFYPNEVTSWTDGGSTALCPYCGVDSVIPNATEDKLKVLHRYYIDPRTIENEI